jgi:hypothetical protein
MNSFLKICKECFLIKRIENNHTTKSTKLCGTGYINPSDQATTTCHYLVPHHRKPRMRVSMAFSAKVAIGIAIEMCTRMATRWI